MLDLYFNWISIVLAAIFKIFLWLALNGLLLAALSFFATFLVLIVSFPVNWLYSVFGQRIFDKINLRYLYYREEDFRDSTRFFRNMLITVRQFMRKHIFPCFYTKVFYFWVIVFSPVTLYSPDEIVSSIRKHIYGKEVIFSGEKALKLVHASVIPGRPSKFEFGLEDSDIDKTYYFRTDVKCQQYLSKVGIFVNLNVTYLKDIKTGKIDLRIEDVLSMCEK